MQVEEAGFDEYCMWHTAHTEDKGSRYADPLIYQNGAFLQHSNGLYGPDVFTDYLLDFIETAIRMSPFLPTIPWRSPTAPLSLLLDSETWSR